MTKELLNMAYPTNIVAMIEETDGVDLFEDAEDTIIVYDHYEENDRFITINKKPVIRPEQVETFGSSGIEKEQVIEYLQTLPEILLMHFKKLYVVSNEEDIDHLYDEDESPNHTFSFDQKAVGMAVFNDSTVILNAQLLKSLAIEESRADWDALGYCDDPTVYFQRGWQQTLAHEMFHLAQFNPLIEEVVPQGEEVAEEFCRGAITV